MAELGAEMFQMWSTQPVCWRVELYVARTNQITNQIAFRQIRFRFITSHFLVNNVYLIVYSNCIMQNEILKLLRRIHVAPSATVSELFTQFKGSFDVFKITPASAICLFFILSAFAFDLYYFTLSDYGFFFFFFSFFLSVFHSLINSTFPNSKGLSC